MAATHFVEVDEEVISTISRLRASTEVDNLFVFPKRALILQSIINLKLLEREARKLGKRIIISTQDNDGLILAGKAGLATQTLDPQTLRESSAPRVFPKEPLSHAPVSLPRSTSIGSNEFYGASEPDPGPPVPLPRPAQKLLSQPEHLLVPGEDTPPQPSFPQPKSVRPLPPAKPLRIRDMSPPARTSLNSNWTPPERNQPQNIAPPVISPPIVSPPNTPLRKDIPTRGRLERFARSREATPPIRNNPPALPPRAAFPKEEHAKFPWLFVLLGGGAVALLLGAILFLFLPHADVFIEPQGAAQDFKYTFVGASTPPTDSATAHPMNARVVSDEQTITLTEDATGTGDASNTKATGSVIITNRYSTDPQPLVATTRLLSSDGKLFHLIDGVTVPGMSGGQPGVIEVKVVADQGGSDFNIPPSDFTIPGFQGGAKYTTFTGKSSQAFTGGGSGGSGTVKIVRPEDITKASDTALDNARQAFIEEINKKLEPGEKLLEETLEITPSGTPSSPAPGAALEHFDYSTHYKIRAFVIHEQAIRDVVAKESLKSPNAESVVLQPVSYDLEYGTPLSHFDEGRVEVSVTAKAVLRASIDTEALKKDLLGKNEDGIKSILSAHPEVKRLRVEFKPKVFIASIPTNPKRVTVSVVDSGS